jgi:hypothetical protein
VYKAEYGMGPIKRWALLIGLLVVTVGLVPAFVDLALTATGPLASVILLVLCAAWSSVAILCAGWVAFSVELTDTELIWHAPLRGGRVPNDTVADVRPVPVMAIGGVHKVTTTEGKSFWVLVSYGFHELMADVKAAGSEPDVRYSRAVGRVERMPGKNQYRRLTDEPDKRRRR